jgi:hypothetical protein
MNNLVFASRTDPRAGRELCCLVLNTEAGLRQRVEDDRVLAECDHSSILTQIYPRVPEQLSWGAPARSLHPKAGVE